MFSITNLQAQPCINIYTVIMILFNFRFFSKIHILLKIVEIELVNVIDEKEKLHQKAFSYLYFMFQYRSYSIRKFNQNHSTIDL